MAEIIFRCPVTSMNVQLRLDDGDGASVPKDSYEMVKCPACSRLHFINKSSGRLLGDLTTAAPLDRA